MLSDVEIEEAIEEIKLSTTISATIGFRLSITRKGLDWFGGRQIDQDTITSSALECSIHHQSL